ncbi:MAG TPA: RimJ/RimL family protein N-acetyltransferase, partial [Actinomycetota bacterium]|nr:RimJ/RimL family protein N-acetyltransferase [Actinomycetota bacterium]
MNPDMRLQGSLVLLEPLEQVNPQALADFRDENRVFLEPFEPSRLEDFFTVGGARRTINEARIGRLNDTLYAFGMFERTAEQFVGHISLSNVVRGAWQSATLGYAISE